MVGIRCFLRFRRRHRFLRCRDHAAMAALFTATALQLMASAPSPGQSLYVAASRQLQPTARSVVRTQTHRTAPMGLCGSVASGGAGIPIRWGRRSIDAIRVRGGGGVTSTSAGLAASSQQHKSEENGGGTTELPPRDYASSTLNHVGLQLDLPPLDVHARDGLSGDEAGRRREAYGLNALAEPPGKSLWALILEQFEDRLVQILLVVALLSGVFSYLEHDRTQDSLLQSFVEPLIITTILVLNAAVGVWQSKSAEGSLEALKQLQPSLATVLRDGAWVDGVDATHLVPGDVVRLRVGNKVPADARLLHLQASRLTVDEGSLTGESVTVDKLPGDEGTCDAGASLSQQLGMIFSGTMVTSGAATALVVRTGMDTEFGKIQQGVVRAQQAPTKTPLAHKLDEFGSTLTVLIAIICLTVFTASIPKFTDPGFTSVWAGALYYAKVAVALGVAAIPEGLPAVITLCLSLGTRRMAQRNVIVRKLPSVETLGSTNVICTDKTGTLTLNEMTVTSLVTFEEGGGHVTRGGRTGRSATRGHPEVREHVVSGLSYSPLGDIEGVTEEDLRMPAGSMRDIAAVGALCNDADIVATESSKEESRLDYQFERVGEPTEAALCTLVEKLSRMGTETETSNVTSASDLGSYFVSQWRHECPRIATLEFSRDRKSMSVLSRMSGGTNSKGTARNRLLVKGAPNLLLERCTHVKLRSGKVARLTPDLRRRIESTTAKLASRPLRCLALAVREPKDLPASLQSTHGEMAAKGNAKLASVDVSGGNPWAVNPRDHALLKDPSNYVKIESDLTLVGIVGMMDPARPEVADSMVACRNAGIRVIMITGDAKDTAVAIARDVNIFPRLTTDGSTSNQTLADPDGPTDLADCAFEGREFFSLSNERQLEVLSQPSNILFCRAEPSDKQRLISLLQELKYVPAMTGDGVNDAPALQQAAIGISMGITGTEVAKSASDMIITDDNFVSIVHAVEEGRCIYANMQSFINFLISCNIGEVFTILLSTLLGVPEPLSAMHLLWVNLVTDGPPATALGFNPPSDDLMLQKPRPADEPILTRWLLTRYTITGLYVGLATVGIFINYYLSQGITISELCSWSKCGTLWQPPSHLTCNGLFQPEGRMQAQTLSLTTLVCMEMIKALGGVSVDNSIFKFGPQKNPWLVLGVIVPFGLHLAVVYSAELGIPGLGESFGMTPLSLQDWVSVLQWAVPILAVDETLKFVGRNLAK